MRPRDRDALPLPGSLPRVLHRTPTLLLADKPPGWSMAATEAALDADLPPCAPLEIDASGVVAFGEGRLDQTCRWVTDGDRPQLRRADEDPKTLRRRVAVRGDARREPLDLRAPRALVHRERLRVGRVEVTAPLPPDFAPYTGGDPRAGLRADPDTTCFREWHGAFEGRPAQLDRYGDWLWGQSSAGPPDDLPDARGVYWIDGRRDRSRGAQEPPRRVHGEAAPTPLVVLEHGVRYRVELGDQLSTGLFLDQRRQRAWLAANASGMRVLNTFAHAGAFSVAAGVAGAETVSVDLSRAWLARVAPQLAENGVDPARHDTIYGDVFDWIRRLTRRGETYDLVILDPPSTSVGKRKKRWSAARDYGELVALTAPLVAPGGALWTITNHQKTSAGHFAQRVSGALPEWFELERVCPPGVDCPTRGPAPVKTMTWRDRR